MFAITQTEYYLTILKYCTLVVGGTAVTVFFVTAVWFVVFYSHYWK